MAKRKVTPRDASRAKARKSRESGTVPAGYYGGAKSVPAGVKATRKKKAHTLSNVRKMVQQGRKRRKA